MSGLATEVLQEGVRIPPIKVFEEGRPVKAAMDLLYANMRVPEERQGDFRAMRSTCLTAEDRVLEVLARYGRKTVFDAVDQNIERTTERTREHIRALPDGIYRAEDYLEFYHHGIFDPVMLRVALEVRDDSLRVDFTGSSTQVAGVVNASLAVSAAGVVIALKAFFDPTTRSITAFSRPSRSLRPGHSGQCCPPGSLRSACGDSTPYHQPDLGGLAKAHPERMAGDMQGTSNHTLIGGIDDRTGRAYVFYEVPVGGAGGFLEHDGPTVFGTVDWAGNQPILPWKPSRHTIRSRCPRGDQTRLGADTAGVVEDWGLRLELKLLARQATFSLVSDRALVPPYGVLGGGSGAPNTYGSSATERSRRWQRLESERRRAQCGRYGRGVHGGRRWIWRPLRPRTGSGSA